MKIEFKDRILIDSVYCHQGGGKTILDFFIQEITRNEKPIGRQIYILHEGFLGVFGEELKEKDYDDIEKENFSISSSKGWLGITDKYWLTAIVPEKGKEFKAEFSYKM